MTRLLLVLVFLFVFFLAVVFGSGLSDIRPLSIVIVGLMTARSTGTAALRLLEIERHIPLPEGDRLANV